MKQGFEVIDEIMIPSTFDAVHEVEKMIDKVCSEIGVREDSYGNVLIAVTEAVNNAIIHGNNKQESMEVAVAVANNDRDFCFTIKDQGNGFDYNGLPDPTAPENIEKENGRGIFLMRNLSDEVEFEDYGRRVNIYFRK